MDSLTQFVLGAAVGVVGLGRVVPARRAAILGGLVATLPDLDVLIPAADPVQAFVGHRGFSHSIFVHTLLTPALGLICERLMPPLREKRWVAWLTIWLVLVTHALLDCMTTYGTRFLWPFSDAAISWSSIFIIDPLYTVPLLAACVLALAGSGRSRSVASAALVMSSAYLGWTLIAREMAETKVVAALDAAGVSRAQLKMIPMPFNSFLWRGLAVDGDRFANVYVSVLDRNGVAPVFVHPRGTDLPVPSEARAVIDAVARFTQGFYGFEREGDALILGDLRLGVTPNYVFSFRIGRINGGHALAEPPVRMSRPYDLAALPWLWRRIFDETAHRVE